ncbi:unnamed protein product [Spirodela intermedia]|uniref:Uncharacterized protein n=1 Tax=Spirodela intermedia TaxID=51605 RepID=A0A7I8IWE3_SPIIN|nr:unnamed protein product [Spirodela intermedia]CAA6661904.1 unnamed protein product [Spirodela intermedia]
MSLFPPFFGFNFIQYVWIKAQEINRIFFAGFCYLGSSPLSFAVRLSPGC